MRNKKIKLFAFSSFILLISIGFAVLNSNLKINGVFNFTHNEWDIHFENVELLDGSVNNNVPVLSENNTIITFSAEFNKSSDYYIFFVDIVNNSTVDAMMGDLAQNNLTDEQKKYLDYRVTYVDGKDINSYDPIDVNARVRVKVLLQIRSDIESVSDLPENVQTINVTLLTNVMLANKNAKQSVAKKLRAKVVTTGDGLYASTYEDGKYVYRGNSPNNYINFNGEVWRIISIEKDGTLKIIRNDSIGKLSFDDLNSKRSSNSTFCRDDYQGCSAWAKTSDLIGKPNNYILYHPNGNSTTDTILITGTVNSDASLNKYLNSTYYNSMLSKKYIINGKFNVGSLGNMSDKEDLFTNYQQLKEYVWYGKIGLIEVMEYMESATNVSSYTINDVFNLRKYGELNTWLHFNDEDGYWAINPSACGLANCSFGCFDIDSPTSSNVCANTKYVRPVVYLSSSIQLTGYGTSDNPYLIS